MGKGVYRHFYYAKEILIPEFTVLVPHFFFTSSFQSFLFLNFLLCTRILGLLFSEIICSFTTNENDFMNNKKQKNQCSNLFGLNR